jgi:hypothetical protein
MRGQAWWETSRHHRPNAALNPASIIRSNLFTEEEWEMATSVGEEAANAQVDQRQVKLLFGNAAELRQDDLTAPDFTYRQIWPNPMNGWWRLTLNSPDIRSSSNVYVSVSELDPIVTSQDPVPKPMMGDAHFLVYNVAPRNGAVEIRLFIDWPTPLLTQVSYLVVNP